MLSIFLIALSLAMDAFAVAVSSSMSVRSGRLRDALTMGLYFGGFQFAMPLLGWVLGRRLSLYIVSWGHLLAFALLALIGVRMIMEAVRPEGRETGAVRPEALSHSRLTALATATSIDALAAGVSMAFLNLDILCAAAVIGAVAFALSVCGGLLGRKLGLLFRRRAEIAGGTVLILIGLRLAFFHSVL